MGGLDEENLAVAFNDVDFCLKIYLENLRIIWTPYAELYHHESASRGQEDTPEKEARFASEIKYMKEYWQDSFLGSPVYDPAYSPNLDDSTENFGFALPPRVPASPLDLQVRKFELSPLKKQPQKAK